MAKSALLKSSLAKKYWMAATGLFLCVFLLGHLSGNFQLFIPGIEGKLQFNNYAVFMTTNPAVKILSYLTYFSILFHAIDGIALAIQNKKARPVNYAKSSPGNSSSWASRSMAMLGTLVLLFIVGHMYGFWFQYKFGTTPFMVVEEGVYLKTGDLVKGAELENGNVVLAGENLGAAMKDLHGMVLEAFKEPLIIAFYVLSMLVLAFHLSHGFASAFQSLGLNHRKYTPTIKKVGAAFAWIVSLAFASIPLVLHFSQF